MQTVEQLKEQIRTLTSNLRFQDRISGNFDAEIKKIKNLEKTVYKLEAETAINSFNKENERRKALLTEIVEAEKLEKSYFKNDGYFTINSLKRLPKWNKLVEKYNYINVVFYSDCIHVRIDNNAKLYIKGDLNLIETLQYNNIKENLTLDMYIHFIREFEQLNEQFKQFSKMYSDKLKELNVYQFNEIGLTIQSNCHFYQYISSKNFIKE